MSNLKMMNVKLTTRRRALDTIDMDVINNKELSWQSKDGKESPTLDI
jgi:hypothetical protein